MGFTITEELTIPQFALSLAGLHYTFKGSFNVQKIAAQGETPAQYRITGIAYVYTSTDTTKNPISAESVSLTQEAYPADPLALLYVELKAKAQFVDKTITDN